MMKTDCEITGISGKDRKLFLLGNWGVIGRGFRFNVNMFMFNDPSKELDVHPGSNWVSMVEIDNGDSKWLD